VCVHQYRGRRHAGAAVVSSVDPLRQRSALDPHFCFEKQEDGSFDRVHGMQPNRDLGLQGSSSVGLFVPWIFTSARLRFNTLGMQMSVCHTRDSNL
jgi:hypothetical protein